MSTNASCNGKKWTVWVNNVHINQNFLFFAFFSAVGAAVHRRGVGERVERTAKVGLQRASNSPQQKREHQWRVRAYNRAHKYMRPFSFPDTLPLTKIQQKLPLNHCIKWTERNGNAAASSAVLILHYNPPPLFPNPVWWSAAQSPQLKQKWPSQ